MKKSVIWSAGILCIILLFIGCGKQKETEPEYVLYYTNESGTKLVEEDFEPKGMTASAVLSEFLEALEAKYKKRAGTIYPRDLEILKYDWNEDQLTVYFGEAYLKLSKAEEVLLRAGLVRTVTQLSGIQYVSFMVNEIPLADASGNPIGLMSAETFVENEASSYQETTLTLFFANESGDMLVETTREVYYKLTTSIERLVVEQLIAGPEKKGYPVIPAATKILNVTVEDGICYVNLNDSFMSAEYDVTAQLPIYAIVNSLSELPGVNKVQISINGDSKRDFREMIPLEEPFERNLDLVETDENTNAE